MPLIIHPESSCDVCLESLTCDESRPPCAIPCGHVFCGSCLHQIHPRICPLCREPYLLEPVKKLITGESSAVNEGQAADGRPAANDPDEDDNLLRRLVVSWDTQEEQLLLTEVDTWLQSRPESTSLPLRGARRVFTSYRELTTHAENDQQTISHLESNLQFHERLASSERFTAVAVEQSLLEQMEELHIKLSQNELENEKLREEISALKRAKSPSPLFPKPLLPEDLLPFARPDTSGSNTHHQYTSAEISTITHPTSRSPYSVPSPPTADFEFHTCSDCRREIQRAREDTDWWGINRLAVAAPGDLPANETGDFGVNARNRTVTVSGATPNRANTRTDLFGGPVLGLHEPPRHVGRPRDERPAAHNLYPNDDADQAWRLDPHTPTTGTLRLIRKFPVFV